MEKISDEQIKKIITDSCKRLEAIYSAVVNEKLAELKRDHLSKIRNQKNAQDAIIAGEKELDV